MFSALANHNFRCATAGELEALFTWARLFPPDEANAIQFGQLRPQLTIRLCTQNGISKWSPRIWSSAMLTSPVMFFKFVTIGLSCSSWTGTDLIGELGNTIIGNLLYWSRVLNNPLFYAWLVTKFAKVSFSHRSMLIHSSIEFWEKLCWLPCSRFWRWWTSSRYFVIIPIYTLLFMDIYWFVVLCTLPSYHLHYISDSFSSDLTFVLLCSLPHGAQAWRKCCWLGLAKELYAKFPEPVAAWRDELYGFLIKSNTACNIACSWIFDSLYYRKWISDAF